MLGDRAPVDLTAAGRLRLAHPGVSLAVLGGLADPPMSKDTVAGRLRRAHRHGGTDRDMTARPPQTHGFGDLGAPRAVVGVSDLVDEFHRRPGSDCVRPSHPTVSVPGALDRIGYVEEEVQELREAVEAGDVVKAADAPAQRSTHATRKASRHHDEHHQPIRGFRGLLHHLATLTRNDIQHAHTTVPTLTIPTPTQRHAFELLGTTVPLTLR